MGTSPRYKSSEPEHHPYYLPAPPAPPAMNHLMNPASEQVQPGLTRPRREESDVNGNGQLPSFSNLMRTLEDDGEGFGAASQSGYTSENVSPLEPSPRDRIFPFSDPDGAPKRHRADTMISDGLPSRGDSSSHDYPRNGEVSPHGYKRGSIQSLLTPAPGRPIEPPINSRYDVCSDPRYYGQGPPSSYPPGQPSDPTSSSVREPAHVPRHSLSYESNLSDMPSVLADEYRPVRTPAHDRPNLPPINTELSGRTSDPRVYMEPNLRRNDVPEADLPSHPYELRPAPLHPLDPRRNSDHPTQPYASRRDSGNAMQPVDPRRHTEFAPPQSMQEPLPYGHVPSQRPWPPVYTDPQPGYYQGGSGPYPPTWGHSACGYHQPGYAPQRFEFYPSGMNDIHGQRRRRGNLPKAATNILKQWFDEHRDSPYPAEDEKLHLCSLAGLGMNQASALVSNWFINARRRLPNRQKGGDKAEQTSNTEAEKDTGGSTDEDVDMEKDERS